MPGMSLEFMVTGDEIVALELRGLQARLLDASPAFALLQRAYEENHERWFATRGSRTWPPLADSTKKRKRREGLPAATLRGKSDRLHESLTSHTPDSVRVTGPGEFAFGTQVPWARFHRYGTVNMPERNPLVRTVLLEPETVELLSEYLVGPIGKRQRRMFGGRRQEWWLK